MADTLYNSQGRVLDVGGGGGESQHNYLTQLFPRVTIIGDSLSCGFTSVDGVVIGSATARPTNNNWPGYMMKRLGFSLNHQGIGSSTSHHWRYADGPTSTYYPDIPASKAATDCYMIGIGVNDLRGTHPIGSIADIAENKDNNADSFYGNYDYMIRNFMSANPYAHFFCFTIPKSEGARVDNFNIAIETICNLYPSKVHCIRLDEISDYTSGIIADNFTNGHYNPLAYNLMSVIIEDEISKFIKNNYSLFKLTPYR